ncbi:hypothetical protein BDW59DRAFT_138609 [Aspergillus cavernicola]|uniref:Pentatricopeptide repeat protein n=1 Tax=Aspergillus cavernicola TaxID=176166 RepID=A0ABR4J040_9EURO
MPHPNKSQNPPHLRLPPSQGSKTGLPTDPKSMRTPASFFSNAYVRRIGSSRRARPVATAIADIFVRSLVLAGYCHEHSPQSRALNTVSTKSMGATTKNWGDRALGDTPRRLLVKGPPGSLSSRVESLGVHRPRTQRMFNSSVAQRLEVYDEDHRAEQASAHGSSHRTHVDDVKINHAECLGKEPRLSPRNNRTDYDRLYANSAPHDDRNDVRTHRLKDNEVDHTQYSIRDVGNHPTFKSSQKKLYQYTSEIYQAVLGKSLDWQEAVDAVATYQPFSPQTDKTRSAVESSSVQRLVEAIWDKDKSNHYIFTLYRELPSPGMIHLSKRSRGALLRRFANPRDRRWVDARRYLALVEDMMAANLSVSRSLWSSAIHLAGRATGRVTKEDLIRAIGVWNQMEYLAGIQADGVVFNVLFDIAIKAGQYTVADRLIEEMERRNIQFGRSGKVTKIYYHGLLGDANGVRLAFDEFVKSGEIVDTAVMNCLIASFLRSDETQTAEQIYYQLLRTQATTQSALDSDHASMHVTSPNLTSELAVYRKRTKKLGRVLELSASLKDSFPDHHRTLQEALLVAPDTRTFHVLLSHYAYKTGDLKAFVSVLDDMKEVFPVPPRGMIYLLLFDGFAHQGRHRKGWVAEKLWTVWKAYLRALYESKTRLYHRSYALPPSFVWENPLRSSRSTASSTPPSTNVPSKLYTPLPSVTNMRDVSSNPRGEDADEDVTHRHDEDFPHFDGGIDISDILGQAEQGPRKEDDELESLERRLENGVFLGRRMIMIILRAFGACCGPDDVMEVWLRMETIWQPAKRKGLDVLAVKEELEKQLNRASKRPHI